ncbi:MAG: UDP-N-acetylmuramoyl-L-alanyl-D-glutamate--2,6-diaminopimelate ligase [Lachnospiraceae bacterium]|nr:UDP-N-acetylmuramoyl-L-alanyl-D-glutamate--2,6-diaminopimelate ligase [Lachnospiraceae bacterium]
MKLDILLEGLSFDILSGSTDVDIQTISGDSRTIGAGSLFFCVKGAAFDGHEFAEDVAKKGAVALIVEKEVKLDPSYSVTIVKVDSVRHAMGIVAAAFYGQPAKELTVIGITGTKGKTTTTYMIREMLEGSGIKTGLIGTIETIIGDEHIPSVNTTPESLKIHEYLRKMVDIGCKSVVMEVSSQAMMLDRVSGLFFDYAIFSNLSEDHIGPNEHGSFEEYRDWKKKLFDITKVGIFNADDEHAEYMMADHSCDKLTYGLKNPADYKADDAHMYNENAVLGVEYTISGKMTGEIKVDMPGDFSVHNSLAAIAVAKAMGASDEVIKKVLTGIKVRGRVELIPISDAFTIMIDYAHNAMSLESLLKSLKLYEPKRLVTLFGCGGNRAKSRRFEMGEVSGNMSDLTIITSDNPRDEDPDMIMADIVTGISKTTGEYIEIADRKDAIRYAIMNAKEGDVIVLAGKGHEDYQIIKGVKHHMDERELIGEILKEEDVEKICGYNNRYFA